VPLGLRVRLRPRRADDVEAELIAEPPKLLRGHAR
jgi:hypothetical protein